jgi:hypothetical protein
MGSVFKTAPIAQSCIQGLSASWSDSGQGHQ